MSMQVNGAGKSGGASKISEAYKAGKKEGAKDAAAGGAAGGANAAKTFTPQTQQASKVPGGFSKIA